MASAPRSSRTDPVRTQPVLLALAVLFLLYAAWQVFAHSGGGSTRYGDLFFPVVDVLAVAMALRAAHVCGDVPGLRRFWRTVALALLVLTLADVAQTYYDFAFDDPPYPSWADALYLAFYPLMFLAIVRLPVPDGMRTQQLRTILDVTIAVVGVGALVWYFVLGPQAQDGVGDTLDKAVTLSYPIGDVILLTTIAAAYYRRSPVALRPSMQALGAGLALYVLADVITGYGSLHGTYVSGDPVDVLYFLAACALALAGALQQPVRAGTPDVATPDPAPLIGKPSLIPYVALGTGFGLLLSEFWDQPFFPGLSLIILVIYLGVLVSLRQYIAQRETGQLQRRMGMILESMGEGVITFTETGRILSANHAAEDAFLAHPEQLVGMSMESLFSNVDWEQRGTNLNPARGPRDPSMLGQRQMFTGRRLDGTTFPLEFLVSEARIDGERVLIGVGQDVSERLRTEKELRESERRFHTVFDNAGVGIVVIDLSSEKGPNVVDVNAAFAEMVGYDVDELRGDDLTLTSHPVDNVMSDEHLRDWLMRGTSASFQRDIPYVRRDGSVMWGNITFSAIRGDAGVAVYVIGVFEDITQRRKMEQIKDEFVSVVGHELRTPLTSIRGSLGLLEAGVMGELPPEAGEMLTMAVSNTDRLVRLINDMLDIERMDAGRADMEIEPVAAADAVEQTRQAVAATAMEAGVTLSIDVEDGLVVCVDADRIVQALVNLVGNAVKFSDANGTVEIAAARAAEDEHGADMALFTVHDSGRGIPADDLESIFERFHQVDSSDARDKGGTGLGLPIARGIVEHHGGRLWAESAPGAGTTFRFTLPIATAPTPLVTVLVCGDDAGDAEQMAVLATGLRCTALRARDLQQALETITTRAPGAVLVPAGLDAERWTAGVAPSCTARGIPVLAMGCADGSDGLLSALREVVPALR